MEEEEASHQSDRILKKKKKSAYGGCGEGSRRERAGERGRAGDAKMEGRL